MRFSAVAATLLSVGAAVAQTTHTVKVGANGALTYEPNTLTGVADGDSIEFQFLSKNHTVTQSTFAAPCSNITDASGAVTGVDSGYQFVDPAATDFPVWKITINNASAPLWFFCRQAKHCSAGMVMAVNPTQDKTFDAFKAKAQTFTDLTDGAAAAGAAATGTTGGAAGTTGGAAGTTPAAAPVGSAGASGSTTPSASPTGAGSNGAGALHFSAGAAALSVAGLALGLLL